MDELKIVNVMPTFWKFCEAAQGKARPEQVELFRKMVIMEHPEVFTPMVLQMSGDAQFEHALDLRIEELLSDLSPHRQEGIKETETRLLGDMASYVQEFRAKFSDMHGAVVVYMTISLGSFSGEQRPVNGRFVLLLGLDNILPSTNLGVLVEHELFHLYHFQKVNPFRTVAGDRGIPIYWWIWEEGFATYASRILNPVTDEKTVFFSEADLMEQTRPHLPHLAKLLLKNMDLTSGSLYSALITGGREAARRLHPSLPERSGYVIGFNLVENLSKRYGLDELVELTGGELRSLIDDELQKMAAIAK